jgi:hypothetical protein
MDPWTIFTIVLVGGYLIWLHLKNKKAEEKAQIAKETLRREQKLYENIKKGMREFLWWMQQGDNLEKHKNAQHREVLFENADLVAYKVNPDYEEGRIGFYFKETGDYGMFGIFYGNGDERHESYYRTNKTFDKTEPVINEYD